MNAFLHKTILKPLLLLSLLVTFWIGSVQAQDGQNWLQALVDENLTIVGLQGGSAFATTPTLTGQLFSTTGSNYNVYAVGGNILRPAVAGYCSFVLLGSDQPLEVPTAGSSNFSLQGFCLELPAQATKPDETVSYLPLTYGGEANETVLKILERARSAELGDNFATQLAIWQSNLDLSLSELEAELDQDLSQYQVYTQYLIEGGDTPPPPTPEPQPIPAESAETNATPAAGRTQDNPVITSSDNTQNSDNVINSNDGQTGDAQTNPETIFGFPRTLFWGAVALILTLLITSIVLLVVALRGNRKQPQKKPTPKVTVPTVAPMGKVAYSAPVSEKAVSGTLTSDVSSIKTKSTGQKCLICSSDEHSTRECPEIQRPNQAFMPTEVELTLANVDDLIAPEQSGDQPNVPELDAFWERNSADIGQAAHFLAPPTAVDPRVDEEFFAVAKLRSKINADIEITDTSPLIDDEGPETSPVARRHVTYVIHEEGKADVIGSLGDDGGVISRINLKDSQILLPPKDVSTPHALLRLRPDGRVTIKDLRSRNGTFVGETRLEDGKQRPLQDGDHIRFGDSVEFELDLQRRKLVSLNNNSITRDLNSADQWLITRRNLHSVVIPNTHLSSPHMLIRPSDDVASEIRIKDLHSHNPTIVDNDLKLSELNDGTFIDEEKVIFKVGKITYSITARSLKSVDVIGKRYQVIKQVYISKMADVYAVKDNEDAESPLFAAKILNTHQEKSHAAREAFQKEITLMQALDNPHLVPCLTTGHDDSYDAPYYIMPFLEGSDMRRVLHWRRRQAATGALRLADIREIFHAMCSALETIHKLNIAHCDLKPANIFITHQREIRLLDLGVVTPFGQHAEFFTQFYSAPEVGSKQLPPVSRASDVYSLGVLLLEMLTGIEAKEMSGYATEPAQDVSNTESSKPQHSLENLKQWLEGVPSRADFLPVIVKASQRESAERYQSIAEFVTAFDTAFAGEAAQIQLADEGSKANLAALSRQTDGI